MSHSLHSATGLTIRQLEKKPGNQMRMEQKQRHKSVPEYHHQMKGMGEEEESRGWMDGFVSGEIVYSKIEWEIDFFPKDVVFISLGPPEKAWSKEEWGVCMSFPRPEMGRQGKESLP